MMRLVGVYGVVGKLLKAVESFYVDNGESEKEQM